MDKLEVGLPPRLTEEEIEAKILAHEREQAAKRVAEAEEARNRIAERKRREQRLVGIPAVFREAGMREWESGLLTGPTGVGKSHLAAQRLSSVQSGVWMDFADMIETRRVLDFADREPDEEWVEFCRARWGRVMSPAPMVLDDLGARRVTDYAADVLYEVVNRRWVMQRPTLVTSNLTPGEISTTWGDRIASRVLAFGKWRVLAGQDRRLVR